MAPKREFIMYVTTFDEGLASDIFNYVYAEQLRREGVRCDVVVSKNSQVICIAGIGTVFARCCIFGKSFGDCFSIIISFLKTLHNFQMLKI